MNHPTTRHHHHRHLTILAALITAITATLLTSPAADVVHAAPREHRVTLFTDSVGLGAKNALPKAFPSDWDVYTRGEPALFTHRALQRQIIPNQSLIGDHVVMAVGYNFEFFNTKLFDDSVDQIIEYLTSHGAKHIYWVTLREVKPQYISQGAWNQIQPYSWYFPDVNEHLRAAVVRHPELTLVDWAANADRSGITYDAIHLNNTGAALYSSLIAEAVDNAGVKDFRVSSRGPLGAVSVVGDSVLRGSGGPGVSLPDRLVERGWGPVRFRASADMEAGAAETADDAASWVRDWRAGGWDALSVIVNLGVNDVEVCQSDAVCARGRVVALLDEIGPGHRVWWPQITHGQTGWADTWNTVLADIAGERADVFTWDWPAEKAAGGYSSSDNVHLTTSGYQQRSAAIAAAFTHDLTRSRRVGGDAALPTPTADPSTYLPLVPARVIDTRPIGAQPDGSVLTVDFGDLVPPGATAVAINVTATRAAAAGFLAAGPCGTSIGASTVNFTAVADRAAMTVIPLGANDDVCIYNSGETDIIVDLQGAFVIDGGSKLNPLAVPARIQDTRPTGLLTDTLVVPTPPGATAVAVNLTVDHAAGSGFLTAVPCGAATGVSNVNFGQGEAVAGAAYITTSPDNTICVQTSVPADVIVDLTATFGADGLSFTPVTPTRMLDTRNNIGGWAPMHGNGQTLDFAVTPPDAAAVTGTLTEVEPITNGYLTAFACPTQPTTSSVNANHGLVLANSLTTAVSDTGRLCVYAYPTTHTLFDVTGWWTP